MKSLVLMRKLLVFSVFLLLTQHLSAQSDIEALEKSGLKEVFHSVFHLDQDIDSIKLTYFDHKLTYFFVYCDASTLDSSLVASRKIFDINYDGDVLLLRAEFPKLHDELMSPKLLQENWKHTKKDLSVTTSKKSVSFSKAIGFLGAVVKPAKIKALEAYLTKNYNASIIPPADSILIIQTIVEKETGALGQKEILRGEKGAFYDFVFGKDPKHEKYMIYQGFFKPYLFSGRVWRSFADIYVRLNPDGTFTVSATSAGRKFKIKDYKEDPNNPMFYLYD